MKPVIICVDDEILILDSLKMLLKEYFGDGYSIETTDSANDALELIETLRNNKTKIPILISDYIMPGKKGDELLIQAHNKIPDTFKILLTGQAELQGVENAVNKASLYRFLNKPWKTEEFIHTIDEALKSFEHIWQEQIHKTELEISEKKYKQPVENSLDIIFSLDKHNRITSINQSVNRLLQFQPKEILNKPFLDLVYKLDTVNEMIVIENLTELNKSKETISFICDLVNKSGKPIEMVIKLKYAPIDDDFNIFGIASNVKEDLLLELCETESQVYKIGNSLTQIDMICKRISEAIAKYSSEQDIVTIKLSLRELLISLNNKNKKLILDYALDPTKVEIRITLEAVSLLDEAINTILKTDNGFEISKKFFDTFELNENSILLVKNFSFGIKTSGEGSPL
jgi:PAS domain S-box-containing protein